jgi:cytochrome c biogenesis protein CcdA
MWAMVPLTAAAESAELPDAAPRLSEPDDGLESLPPLPDELPPLPEEPSGDLAGNPQTASDIRGTIDLPFFGPVNVNELGMPAFTFLIGLVDGFNPCAMWVLVFLLSILVNIKDRRKILAIAGSFVLVSGCAYFAFMAAWLKCFQLIGLQRKVQILLGIFGITIGVINIKDFFAFRRAITLSIPESAKPGIYRRVREIVTTKYLSIAIAGAVSLAVVVNIIELFCTAGLPALYTQVLTMQQLPAWANYAYLALYNVAYMLDDAIVLLLAVVTLSHRKLQEREGRWLKLISGLVILGLGLAMIFCPDWLGYSAS